MGQVGGLEGETHMCSERANLGDRKPPQLKRSVRDLYVDVIYPWTGLWMREGGHWTWEINYNVCFHGNEGMCQPLWLSDPWQTGMRCAHNT